MPSSQQRSAVWNEQKVVAVDGTEAAWFGLTVAISGNTALIGAMNAPVEGKASQGAVYVYKKLARRGCRPRSSSPATVSPATNSAVRLR